MFFLVYFFLFIVGVSLGSFLNVVIDRGVKGQSLIKKRSHCDYCRKTLSPYDLIPVASFFLLGRKCRYCHHKLSWQYPLVELGTGILIPVTYYLSASISTFPLDRIIGNTCPLVSTTHIHSAYLLLITLFLIVIFMVDLKYQLILDNVITSAIFLTILYYIALILLTSLNFPMILKPLIVSLLLAFTVGTIVAFFFRFLIFISRGRGLGEGDVKLGFWLGLLLGFPKIIPGLFMAFVLGAIVGLWLVLSGKKKLGQTVPLAPFLVIGSYLSLFFGQQIIDWYLKTFL